MPLAAGIVLLAGLGALVSAFTAQYAFDVQPCELCWWQRGPYALAIVLGALALMSQANNARARMFLGLASAVFLVGMGLAIYHTGVEQHWWENGVGCAIKPLSSKNIADVSINDLRNQLLATVGVPCDEITWSFLGLSMANWNILMSLGLAVFAALAACGCVGVGKPCRCCCSKKTSCY
jgi:disulfide bond formation protein DsbB